MTTIRKLAAGVGREDLDEELGERPVKGKRGRPPRRGRSPISSRPSEKIAGSLLDRVKATDCRRKQFSAAGSEWIPVAIAWARGAVTTGQINKALGYKGTAAPYSKLALAFAAAIRSGVLVEK